MIRSISLKNFQSHKETKIELDKGVNIIGGSSDSGKTAIFRALRWLLENKPLGESIRSNWGGDTEVEIKLSDNVIVRRTRGSKDCYRIIEPENTIELKSFGKAVPFEVRDVLNLTDVNIQNQLDPPFLLSKGSSEVSQYLNKIVDLEDIDLSISEANRNAKKAKSDLDYASSNKEVLEAKLEEYDYLDDADKELTRLEILTEDLNLKRYDRTGIIVVLNALNSLYDQKELYSVLVDSEKAFEDLVRLKEKATGAKNEIETLSRLNSSIKSLTSQIKTLKNALVYESEYKKLQEQYDYLWDEEDKIIDLRSLVKNIIALKSEYEELNSEQAELETSFAKLMPKICPLCGNITSSKIEIKRGDR